MNARSALFGRRVHIAGSISSDSNVASAANVDSARDLVAQLVERLLEKGANFVVPVDAEKRRVSDDRPLCFDWLVWKTINDNLQKRPAEAQGTLAIAVQHHKTEDQIPSEFVGLWDGLRATDHVRIENAAQWNMNSKRMEAQARYGDILITLGGSEGVLFLANLYHQAGKPVVPLNLPLEAETTGSLKLHNFGLASNETRRLFRVVEGEDAHAWLNRIRFPSRQSTSDRVDALLGLLEKLERPTAFGVRLLNPKHPDFVDVEDFFSSVVRPVVEDELGYRLEIVDGEQPFEQARVDHEIFVKLHRSARVFADLTGERPNCFLELGYALGRCVPLMVMAREGAELPFDITTLSGLRWKPIGDIEERRDAFRKHWTAIQNRPPLVDARPLIA